ncbi:hypothetical protein H7I87_19945 [Mycobacterium timonense]|uniref:Uncharacterized protein n=1 Tax=Mycobacterium bouchedurhonense TaxID=701041 RepID=A0AAW5RYI9_MYCBC|nr:MULTISPECIES: hypothetical protein [Mycobacterium avium complex (MAC)]MCV6987757.1 hypothetical protein [Mycobacterium bouchedurhonense]MCV6996948.1 hypothetical protein [Mycobacterium timonense]MDV3306899.1 hypothetical protein [Mycobacterium avium subsp. hominissuis]
MDAKLALATHASLEAQIDLLLQNYPESDDCSHGVPLQVDCYPREQKYPSNWGDAVERGLLRRDL